MTHKRRKNLLKDRASRKIMWRVILWIGLFVAGFLTCEAIRSCGKEGEEVDNSPPDTETQVVYKL